MENKLKNYIIYFFAVVLLLGTLGYNNRQNISKWGEQKAEELIKAGNEVSNKSSGWDKAYAKYTLAIMLGKKNDSWAHNCRGLISWKKYRRWGNINDFDEALKDYDKALELIPDYNAVMYNKGLLYSTKGDYETAIENYDESIRTNPKYIDAYEGKVHAYFEMGNYVEAIAFGKETLNKFGDNGDVFFDVAYSYEMMGDYKKAIEYYDKELKFSNRQSWWTFTNASYCKLMVKDYIGAIEYAQNSIKLHENNIHPYNFLAFAELQRGNFDLAEKYTNQAFNIRDRADYMTYYNYAKIKQLKGDKAGAKTRLEKARALYEKDQNVWKFEGFEELCNSLEKLL